MQTEPRRELAKTYDPAAVEAPRYAIWEALGVFHADPDPSRPPFVISMPPPNITGRAHLGHASTYTPMDILTRFHRMRGDNAVWIPGQDHAAIATEAVVVRELAREGLTRESLGRQAYLARVWKWREEYGGIIYEQFRQLGFGPDWQRDRFTMDAGLSAAVTKVFVELHRAGLIYRGTRLVNWDVASQSTLSDAEVEDEDRDGSLWHLRYPAADGSFAIEVATTRPETMLGDTAVAVHPADERYRHLIGKHVILPLVGRRIPIVADLAVEREFGTGAVKVTPAHDQLDYEIGERHGLAMPSVIGFDGNMTGEAPVAYRGLERFEARQAIVRDLAAGGALVRTEPHRLRVPISSRSGAVVEPLLSLQWFCKMEPLARPALEAYRDGRIRFVPERFGRTYEQWLENIRDWNVSRQVWWGHQLPVWYTATDDAIVAESEAEAQRIARDRFSTTELRRDPDTLDTWFSSGLWPFSILGWPAATPELARWYPNAVMLTGREIIFLWVARMVMLGMKFVGTVPFGDVLITPLVFDLQGRKMSKSLGNVIDPLDLIATYGADALRFAVMRQMRLESQELRFDERFCDEAKRFNTKMWNALRYLHGLPEGVPVATGLPPIADRTVADRWILARLRATVERVTAAYERYEFGIAADALLEFIWYTLCDWYLETTKIATPTRAPVLSYVFNVAMRLLHPISPFISEEIWQALPHAGASIVTAPWPAVADIPDDPTATSIFEAIVKQVEAARKTRSELGIAPQEKIELDLPAELGESQHREIANLLRSLANATLTFELPPTAAVGTAAAIRAGVVRAPAAIMLERRRRRRAELDAEIVRLEKKFSNPNFASKAAPEVVAKEREKLSAYRTEHEQVVAALAADGKDGKA
ncbi:MAG: valine--tRNA ligase [Vulcanimicrobiaceae bacterium]